jgi:O-antigen/teichoic acid export membrane protein
LSVAAYTLRVLGRLNGLIWHAKNMHGSFAADALLSVTGAVLARFITLASLPFITRIYAPDDLGVWAILLTLATFLVPLGTLRFDVAVVIAPDKRTAVALIVAMTVGSIGLAAIIGAFSMLGPTWLLQTVTGLTPDRHWLLAFLPVIILTVAAQGILQSWLTRERRFDTLSLSQLAQAIATAVASIALPLAMGADAVAAATGGVIGLLAAVVLMAWSGQPAAGIGRERVAEMISSAIRQYRVYPIYTLPYTLTQGMSERVLQAVLVSTYSLGVLGAFYLARQIVAAPAMLFTTALRQALFAHSTSVSTQEQTKQRVKMLLELVMEIQVPLLVFSLFWLRPILLVALGPSWTELADFAWWFMIGASCWSFTSWLDRMLDVLGRQRLQVAMQSIADIAIIVYALFAPRWGISAVAFIAILSFIQVGYHLIWLRIVLRLMNFSVGEIWGLLARAVGIGAIAAVPQFLVYRAIGGGWEQMAGAAAVILTVGALAIARLKNGFSLFKVGRDAVESTNNGRS